MVKDLSVGQWETTEKTTYFYLFFFVVLEVFFNTHKENCVYFSAAM